MSEILTQEEVLREFSPNWLDGRDGSRLAEFFEVAQWSSLGMERKEEFDESRFKQRSWTREEILMQLARDVEFGFDKALNKRGISASLMHNVVKMWMWILKDPLGEDARATELYAQYGLPYLRAVAIKYGLPNEIGDDCGDEFEYSADG